MIKLCSAALIGLFALAVIRQYRSDLAPLLRIALVIVAGGMAVSLLSPVVSYVDRLLGANHGPYLSILFKGLGVAVLSYYCAELCRECGENGLASSVEFLGKLELLLLCLPLFDEILGAAEKLLALGG